MSQSTHKKTVDFAEVRRKVPLTWFFEHVLGADPKPASGSIRYSICPCPECGASSKNSVKISVKDDKWNCFVCKEHGDVIEAAARYWGMPLSEAAVQLVGADADIIRTHTPPKPKPAVQRDDTALGEVISKLVAALPEPSQEGLDYLCGVRRIPEHIVREACKKGMVLTLPSNPMVAKDFLCDHIGRDLMVQAGLWKPDGKAPAAAFRPLLLVSSNLMSVEFRYLRPIKDGEVKMLRAGTIFPWGWRGETGRVLITEGCIDLLSAVALGTKRSVLGLPGCENWKPEWFSKFRGWDVMVAFDNDGPGRMAFEKLQPVLLQAVGREISRYEHKPGVKDLNEELQQHDLSVAT
ncbi:MULTISPECIES: toprim domain-containing protein [Burkholderia]|uniref:DNA primase n=1 Tax=Burkholderia sp. M701 TaxID=326454 RepID=V5YPB4_9BURK|nr:MULTISPECIES: toprim domain-containing protein [Burkholderia]BAO19242.1 putative DNA primase [Burkholderia sp. M701]